jgi:hypothetical protein
MSVPWTETIPGLNLAIRRNIKEHSFHFIAEMFKEETYEGFYVDSAHYGDRGNRRIAQVIADDVKNTEP